MPKYNLELIDKYEAAQDTPAYRFAKPDDFEYQAGNHMVVQLDFVADNPDDQIRDMTLASSPTEDYLELVMRQGKSEFKQSLVGLDIGEEILMFGPAGTFILQENMKEPIIMIAGGIGITPFRSMIRYILDKDLPYQVTLLYSNPTIDDIAFKKEFDEINTDSNNNIEIIYSLTKESPVAWSGERGRIDSSMIEKHVTDIKKSVFMVCGPENMVHYINSVLLDLGVAQDMIIKEEFVGYEERLF
jgi:ferredoxin-NADP reductase